MLQERPVIPYLVRLFLFGWNIMPTKPPNVRRIQIIWMSRLSRVYIFAEFTLEKTNSTFCACLYMGVSKNNGKTPPNPPNHPFVHRVGTIIINHPFWG